MIRNFKTDTRSNDLRAIRGYGAPKGIPANSKLSPRGHKGEAK